MMQRNIDAGLAELKQHLVRMAGLVENAIEKVIQAWQQKSLERLKEVYDIENSVNAAHLQIDADCLRLLATQQPLAGELLPHGLRRRPDHELGLGKSRPELPRVPEVRDAGV